MTDQDRDHNAATCPFDAAQMELWVAGRLAQSHGRRIDAWLDSHPQQAEYWRSLQRDHAALADLKPELPPRTLSDYALPAHDGARLRWRHRRDLLAAFALGATCALAMMMILPGLAPTPARTPGFVQGAQEAHALYSVEVRHPVEVGHDEQQHLLQWLSKRLSRPLQAPDLGSLGFQLLGGRLLPADSGPAAQLMYQDDSGERITLYIAATVDALPTSFRYSEHAGISSFYWIDGHWGYSLSGRLERDRLSQLSLKVYQALEL